MKDTRTSQLKVNYATDAIAVSRRVRSVRCCTIHALAGTLSHADNNINGHQQSGVCRCLPGVTLDHTPQKIAEICIFWGLRMCVIHE